jgi:serine/threonine-protein kinase
VKLLDFGIAKLLTDGAAHETELTQLGGRALTPQYASPEQILGQPIGTASDVYALGVVLYELLTGSLPYRLKRDSRGALEDAILSADAPRPSRTEVVLGNAQARDSTVRKLVTLLRGDLDTIVLKALKKEAGERYATAQLFADDLRRYLAGEAVLAQPDSTWYRTGKFVRRNWLAVGAAAAVVVALAVGLGVALWQAQVARTSESHARSEAQTAKAVQAFLMDIFQANSSNQVDPQKARNTTARELLDNGANKIDGALADAPPAKLEILKTLGQLYIEMGLNKQSAELQRKRVDLARSIFGAQSGETVDALLDLAQVLSKQLDDPDWEKSLKEAEFILDAQNDTTTLRRARLNSRLAAYYREHELDKAAHFSERALEIYRKFPPDREFVLALMTAADASANRDDYAVAQSKLKEAIAAIQGTPTVASADLLPQLYGTLAEAEYWLESYAEAEKDSRLAWERAKSLNGELDAITLGYLMDYSTILISNGRVGEGIAKMQQAVKTFRSAKGSDEPARLSEFLGTYANGLKYYGQIEEAIRAMREARQVVAHAGDTLRLARLMGEEANILVMLGHVDEASKLLVDAKGMLDRSQNSNVDWAPYDNRTRLEILLAQHRLKEANLLAKDVFAKIATSTSRARIDLIARERLALANGDPKTALALALASIAEIEGGPNRDYLGFHRYSSYQTAGKALLMLHQAKEAEVKLRIALQLADSLFDPRQSPKLAETEIALAQCLLDLQQAAEAKSLAARARAIHTAHKELGEQYRQPLRELERRLEKLT